MPSYVRKVLEQLAPPRQELVGVRLMADIENETVTWAVKHAMQRDVSSTLPSDGAR